MVERHRQTNNSWELDIYNIPTYSVTDASRYLNIPLPTLSTWLNGRKYHTKQGKQNFLPLIQRPWAQMSQLSFTNLIEAHILRVIRTIHNISLDKVSCSGQLAMKEMVLLELWQRLRRFL